MESNIELTEEIPDETQASIDPNMVREINLAISRLAGESAGVIRYVDAVLARSA